MPDPTLGGWLLMAALGGLVALDDAGWPQAMISRPLVAAALGGWLVGDAAAGIAVGAVLELLLLPHQPLGGARCPDPGPASVVAGSAAAAVGASPASVLTAALAGWTVAWAGTVTVRWSRALAARLVAGDTARFRDARSLERRHLASLAAGFARGAVLAAVWWIPVTLLVRAVPSPMAGAPAGPALAAAAVGLAAAGVAGSSAEKGVARVAAPLGAGIALLLTWGAG